MASDDVPTSPQESDSNSGGAEGHLPGTPSAPRRQPLVLGESAPLFFLPSVTGSELALPSLILRGPVIVEFIRGSWDPDARRRLDVLANEHGTFKDLGAQLLVVTCERPAPLEDYVNRVHLPFAVAIDADRSVTKAYGVYQRFSLPQWRVPRPSTFVVDTCGFVRYTYVARLPIHAADVAEIRGTLEVLGRPGHGGREKR